MSISISYFLLTIEDTKLYFAFPFATYFYCFILGFITVKEAIPFSLKVGATRKNLFIAIGLFFLGIALVKALLSNTVQWIVTIFKDTVGINTLEFIHVAQAISDIWMNRLIIDTSIMFFLLSFMYLLGVIFYRTGLIGGGSVAAVLVVILLFGIAKGWIINFITYIFTEMSMLFYIEIFGIGIVLYGLTFFLGRKITTIQAK